MLSDLQNLFSEHDTQLLLLLKDRRTVPLCSSQIYTPISFKLKKPLQFCFIKIVSSIK